MAIIPVTWDSNDKGTSVTLTNNNLTAKLIKAGQFAKATHGKTKGKWYWEITFSGTFSSAYVGIGNSLFSMNGPVSTPNSRAYYSFNGTKIPESTSYGKTYGVNDTIGVALNLDNGTLTFFVNGVSQGISHNDILNLGEVFPFVGVSGAGNTSTANFGATSFKYPMPEGYKPYAEFTMNKILLSSSNDRKANVVFSSNKGTEKDKKFNIFSENVIDVENCFENKGSATTSAYDASKEIIGIHLQKPRELIGIEVRGTGRYVKSLTIQGSNEDNVWNNLHREEISGTSHPMDFDLKINNGTEYLKYRIYINDIATNTHSISLTKLAFHYNVSNTVQITSQSEQSFINYGISPSDLSSIDMSSEFTEKHYIQDTATPIGEGKVFRHDIDMTKTTKKVSVK